MDDFRQPGANGLNKAKRDQHCTNLRLKRSERRYQEQIQLIAELRNQVQELLEENYNLRVKLSNCKCQAHERSLHSGRSRISGVSPIRGPNEEWLWELALDVSWSHTDNRPNSSSQTQFEVEKELGLSEISLPKTPGKVLKQNYQNVKRDEDFDVRARDGLDMYLWPNSFHNSKENYEGMSSYEESQGRLPYEQSKYQK